MLAGRQEFFLRIPIMHNTTVNAALADIRISHHHIETMIRETATLMGDERLADRLRGEPGFHLKAIGVTQNLVVAMTLAQTLAADQKFSAMMGPETFSGNDQDLAKLGGVMLDGMIQAPRLGAMVLEELLAERVEVLRQWM